MERIAVPFNANRAYISLRLNSVGVKSEFVEIRCFCLRFAASDTEFMYMRRLFSIQ